MAKRDLEGELYFQLKMIGVAPPNKEYQFAAHSVGLGPGIRKRLKAAGLSNWRADFAYPDKMLLIECEGVLWHGRGGRHQRGSGFEEDCRKYGKAMELGYSVYRCTGSMIKSGVAAQTIQILLNQ